MNLKPMSLLLAMFIMIIALYLYSMHFSLVEGLANPEHTEFVSKGIKNDIVSLEDSLHISKYQDNYRDIVNDMMQWCDLEILKTLMSNKINISDGINSDNVKLVESLNQFSQFRNTLQSVHDNVLTNVKQL